MNVLIKNGTIVNEGRSFAGSLLLAGGRIARIYPGSGSGMPQEAAAPGSADPQIPDGPLQVLDAAGLHIFPGVIDDQVHFREPGGEEKGTIASESAAAVLGGVTSFMDMPNNNPPAVTGRMLEEKFAIADRCSAANYSFYLGATDGNIGEIEQVDPASVCGVKVFMGSSTGNLLVADPRALEEIFRRSPVLVATHCEEERIIRENLREYTSRYGNDIPFASHPDIRSREACIRSTERALGLAMRHGTRLHIVHVSTAEEIEMIRQARASNPRISAEACVHYLWFSREDYARFGSRIKCNPAIKEETDRQALRRAVKEGVIPVVATDHAPHPAGEKDRPYLQAPSGLPLVQHSLQLMLDLAARGVFTVEEVVARMCHGPAECFNIRQRGYIREGYFADLVLADLSRPDSHTPLHPAYKCGWSPFAGHTFGSSIRHTFVNGVQAVRDGQLTGARPGVRLAFDR